MSDRFRKAITPRNHVILKPAFKSGYPKHLASRFLQKNSGNFEEFFVLVALYEGR